MTTLKLIAFMSLLLGLSSITQAADSGIYAGLSLGGVEANISKADGLFDNFNGKDAAYKFILGVRPVDWLAAEVTYLDLGNPDSNSFSADTNGISGSVLGLTSLGPVIDVFAKGGVMNWKAKINSSKSQLLSRDGTNLVYGGGVIVHLLSLSVRAEYEHFDMDAGANLLSVGVTWTFF